MKTVDQKDNFQNLILLQSLHFHQSFPQLYYKKLVKKGLNPSQTVVILLCNILYMQVGLTAGKGKDPVQEIPTFCGGSIISEKVLFGQIIILLKWRNRSLSIQKIKSLTDYSFQSVLSAAHCVPLNWDEIGRDRRQRREPGLFVTVNLKLLL